MIRKKIYKWHRMLSLLAAVPMIMWSVSGMLHQAGQWWKPKTKMDEVKVKVDSSALTISLDSALRQNCFAKVQGSRIVQYRDEYFYQVRIKKNESCVYISAINGELLINGDEAYAVALAFKMLDNPNAHITHRQFITAFVNFLTVATGLVLVTRFVVRRREKAVPVFRQQFPAGKLA